MRSIIGCFFILAGLLFPGFATALTLTSPAFANHGLIPDEYTYSSGAQCSGGNLSPPLTITDIPAGTQSLALTVLDPDGGDWVHWKAWNIPAATASLPENISATATFNQAGNDFGTAGYGGPCPPDSTHRYVFTLYALNTIFTGEPSSTQLQGAALATATLTGERSPSDAASAAEISAARLFAYGEANYPTIFKGSATSGQYLHYNFRYYPGSGNYLALDTAGVVYILGPFTNNEITSFGPLESLLGSITGWEAVTLPYTIAIQNIGPCEDGAGDFFEGVLTPTAQAGVYTTVFVGGEVITLTVPGDNAFRYSYPDGNGATDDSFQLDFAEQSRSISGSSDWTHSNGCYGSGTISGSW